MDKSVEAIAKTRYIQPYENQPGLEFPRPTSSTGNACVGLITGHSRKKC